MRYIDFESLVNSKDLSEYDGAFNYIEDFSLASTLLGIVSLDEVVAKESADYILGHVCHQDNFYEAAIPVFEILFDAIEISGHANKWVVLWTILDLIRGTDYWADQFGFVPHNYGFPGQFPANEPSTIKLQYSSNSIAADLLDIFERRVFSLIPLVSSEHILERAYSIRLLGASRNPTRTMVDSVMNALDNEELSDVRCGCLLTLGCLERNGAKLSKKARKNIYESILSNNAEISACSVISLLLIDGRGFLKEHINDITPNLSLERSDSHSLPWAGGWLTTVLAEALSKTDAPDEVIVEILVTAFSNLKTQSGEAKQDDNVVEATRGIEFHLMRRLFSNQYLNRMDYITKNELTPLQRSVLTRFRNGGIELTTGMPFGFRSLTEDMDRLIGLETGGLDEEIESYWQGTRVQWPLWKWWHQADLIRIFCEQKDRDIPRKYVLHLFEHKLTAKQLFFAASDAVNGAYGIPHEDFVRLAANRAEELRNEIRSVVEHNEIEAMDGKTAALFVMASLALAKHESIDWTDAVVRAIDKVQPQELREEAAELATEYGLTS